MVGVVVLEDVLFVLAWFEVLRADFGGKVERLRGARGFLVNLLGFLTFGSFCAALVLSGMGIAGMMFSLLARCESILGADRPLFFSLFCSSAAKAPVTESPALAPFTP